MLKTRDLYVFLEICRLKSIRKAAEHLSMSQSALTKIVQQLEHTMGVPLIERLPRGVEPTVYGETLARYARFALTELEHAKETIGSIASGKLGRIRIGANTTAAHVLLPLIIERIRPINPFVDIQVHEDTVENLEIKLRNGELDMILSPAPRIGTDRDIEAKYLLDDQLVLIASAEHELFRSPHISITNVLAYPWVFVGADPIRESQIMPLLRAKGLSAPRWVMETNSVAFLMRFLLNSECVSYQSRRLAETFRGSGILIVPLSSFEIQWPMMISRRANALVTPLMDLLLTEAEKLASELGSGRLSIPEGRH